MAINKNYARQQRKGRLVAITPHITTFMAQFKYDDDGFKNPPSLGYDQANPVYTGKMKLYDEVALADIEYEKFKNMLDLMSKVEHEPMHITPSVIRASAMHKAKTGQAIYNKY